MAFMLEPLVVQLYCGYCEKATMCEAPSASTSCVKYNSKIPVLVSSVADPDDFCPDTDTTFQIVWIRDD
jgi:hypothetical protein